MNYPKTLAIDYGRQRIGTALSYGSLAEPFKVFPNDAHIFALIQALIEEHQVEQVVVGISEQQMAQETQAFVVKLTAMITLPIELTDETLSSAEAHRKLAEKSGKKATPKGPVDHYAAAEFLQNWLDLRTLSAASS